MAARAATKLRSIRILNSAGEETSRIPLDEIRAGAQVSLERATDGSVAIVTTPDANDPQVLYEPSRALLLAPDRTDLRRAATWGTLTALAVLLLATLLDRSQRPGRCPDRTMFRFTSRRPYLRWCWPACLAPLVATYPLLLGRSLVAPGNGPAVHVLYDQPPYSPGTTDQRSSSREAPTSAR